jgi:hypothetical protein
MDKKAIIFKTKSYILIAFYYSIGWDDYVNYFKDNLKRYNKLQRLISKIEKDRFLLKFNVLGVDLEHLKEMERRCKIWEDLELDYDELNSHDN